SARCSSSSGTSTSSRGAVQTQASVVERTANGAASTGSVQLSSRPPPRQSTAPYRQPASGAAADDGAKDPTASSTGRQPVIARNSSGSSYRPSAGPASGSVSRRPMYSAVVAFHTGEPGSLRSPKRSTSVSRCHTD